MPDQNERPRPVGPVVRDPDLADRVVGREPRVGELEVSAERLDDWHPAGEIRPSPAKARQVQQALKDALRAQLESEADNIGVDPDLLAIHGKTGVTNNLAQTEGPGT